MTGTHEVHAQELDALLLLGLRKHVFPGAVCAVGKLLDSPPARPTSRVDRSLAGPTAPADGRPLWGTRTPSMRYFGEAGRLAPGEAEVHAATSYDLASLTKPFVATAALRLAQRGVIDLQAPVWRVLPELQGTHGGESSLASLLAHRSGLSAWERLYEEIAGTPGSLEQKRLMLHAAATRVADSAQPGQSLYSDLGYLLVGETLARAAGTSLDEVVRREVTAPLGLDAQIFYAASLSEAGHAALRERVAPTEACTFRGRLLRGEVHDENCYAFGGIAGHAGLFGTADAVLSFGLAVLAALEGRSSWLDQALLRWALAPRGDGYVVGWDTKSAEASSAGEQFSPQSFGHLGFTGTSIWCDPTRRLCAVLLSNRVHPTRENVAIRAFRPRFHDAVAEFAFTAGA